jgi:polygalacturonase
MQLLENATAALQRKIDEAGLRGGGTVVVPEGEHVCGTLVLKTGVRLHLEHGARIIGSTDLEDYPLHRSFPVRCFADWNGMRALIYAVSAEGIALTGHGVIDGMGAAFACDGTDKDGRPRLIQMIDCKDILVEDVQLRNSGLWLQHYLGCERLRVRGITAWNHVRPNNDFIDIEGCRDVRITDCTSDTDDDGITLKSGCDRPTEDVVIANCVIRAHCNAIKCGTESNGGFRNISISNCVIAPSRCDTLIHGRPEGICGIALESVDGGILENVTISNLAIRGTAAPFFMRLGSRCRPFLQDGIPPPPGQLRHVQISHVEVQDAGPIGCLISGIPGHAIEHVTFRDIRIRLAAPAPEARAAESVPEKEDSYPEATQFGHLPASGFFCRHTRHIHFHQVEVFPHPDDPRPVFVTHHATDHRITV